MSTATDTEIDRALAEDIASAFDELWSVVVLNDDVTTFETVIVALVSIFDHTEQAALRLAEKVHTDGRAVVAALGYEEATEAVRGLHGFKIQATVEPA